MSFTAPTPPFTENTSGNGGFLLIFDCFLTLTPGGFVAFSSEKRDIDATNLPACLLCEAAPNHSHT